MLRRGLLFCAVGATTLVLLLEQNPAEEVTFRLKEGSKLLWPDLDRNVSDLRGTFVLDVDVDLGRTVGPVDSIEWHSISGPDAHLGGLGIVSPGVGCSNFVLSINNHYDLWFGPLDFETCSLAGKSPAVLLNIHGNLPQALWGWATIEIVAVPSADDATKFFKRGDVDGDGRTAVSDAVFLLQSLAGHGGQEVRCADAADVDDDGELSLQDPVFLLHWLFAGGPRPPVPEPWCGLDPTDDDLGNCNWRSSCTVE